MKHFIRVARPLCIGTILCGLLFLQAVGATVTAASGKGVQSRLGINPCAHPVWSVVPSPNGNGSDGLSAVAVVSASDIWAVGSIENQTTRVHTTLVENWDGTQWQIIPSPSPSSQYNVLFGVTAASATDIWAVGRMASASGVSTQTLIEHWDGTSWRVVNSPSPGSENNDLFSVVAVSASDVWAVGDTVNSALKETTLIEHWNGVRWSIVPAPSPGSGSTLSAVTAVSASDAWAVGSSDIFAQTLIEHWNGVRWSIVPAPSPGSGSTLSAVMAVSASDAWAAGVADGSSAPRTLVEHWNGSSWQVVTSSDVGQHPGLLGITAISASDVWAVGSYGTNTRFDVTLTEHWNGTYWGVLSSPSPGSFLTQLVGVAAVSSTDVWAVGSADNSTLVEHFSC